MTPTWTRSELIKQKYKQRGRQFLRLMKVLFREFRGFLICASIGFTTSVISLYTLYPHELVPGGKMTFMQSAYYTVLMTFFETPLPYVEDWRLSPLFFLLPVAGLVTIAEGVVHLSHLLFQRKRFSTEWQQMIAETMENHYIVCGLGNVGIRVVEHLRSVGEEVVVIEQDKANRFSYEVSSLDMPVLSGDARDQAILEKASVKTAKAIIAVTNNDLVNIEAALNAREINPGIRVVLRMFDQRLAKRMAKVLNFEGAYSSSAKAGPLFAQAAMSGHILDSFEFGGTVVNAVELIVEPNTLMVGQTIDEVRGRHEVTILMQERADGHIDWNPAPTNILNVGDKLLIMTDPDGLKRMEPLTRKMRLPRDTHS
jgi:voltage-gated potassium channel